MTTRNTEAIAPTDWHVTPDTAAERCPVCECPSKYLGPHGRKQHRAANPADSRECGWFTRRPSGAFWSIKQVGHEKPTAHKYNARRLNRPKEADATPRPSVDSGTGMLATLRQSQCALREQSAKSERLQASVNRLASKIQAAKHDRRGQRGKPGPAPQTVPPSHVAETIGKAVTLVAYGKSLREAAKAVGTTKTSLTKWRQRWAAAWDTAFVIASESAIATVRAAAGTAKVLADPDSYVSLALSADKWARRQGSDLFPTVSGEVTLCSFYRDWYLPNRLGDARAMTKRAYETALHRWRIITGDPPVKSITTATIALFRDAHLKMRGRRAHLPMSPNSVRSYMRHVQVVLDKLGQPGQRNRDAVGILDHVPYCKPPRAEERIPKTIALATMASCLTAAVGMDVPRFPGIRPPAWWRALLTVAWNTGLRIGTLLSMQMRDIDWIKSRLVLPAARMKSRRPMVVHLNQHAVDAIRSIRTDRELVFPWTSEVYRRTLYKHLHKLQDLAGIPKDEHFGFHTIRKTVATLLWEVNPGAAQYALGHTASDVTRKCYVDGGRVVAQALDQLPQPWANAQAGT